VEWNVRVENDSHDSVHHGELTEEQHDTDPLLGPAYSPSKSPNLIYRADSSNPGLDMNF
jgi:hypothetical protein